MVDRDVVEGGMTAPLWQALGEAPNPISGNCGPDSNDWCSVQATRADAIRLVDNPDPVRGPPKLFRYEVRFQDGQFTNAAGVKYSDQRAMTGPPERLWVNPGTEQWWRWFHLVPPEWVGRHPKQDELGRATLDGGSGFQFHHAWPDKRIEEGSAPLYTGIDDKGPWLSLANADATVWSRWTSPGPLQRGHAYEWLLHIVHDSDPAKGLLEVWVDGQPFVPRQVARTMYVGSLQYPIAGIYRRWSIGDPSLRWPVGTPLAGSLVYPDGDGMRQAQYLGGFVTGPTRDYVMSKYPTTRGGNVAPTPANPAAPEWLWKDVAGGLAAQVAAADAEVQAATQRRDALVKVRDLLASHLNKGDAWLAP